MPTVAILIGYDENSLLIFLEHGTIDTKRDTSLISLSTTYDEIRINALKLSDILVAGNIYLLPILKPINPSIPAGTYLLEKKNYDIFSSLYYLKNSINVRLFNVTPVKKLLINNLKIRIYLNGTSYYCNIQNIHESNPKTSPLEQQDDKSNKILASAFEVGKNCDEDRRLHSKLLPNLCFQYNYCSASLSIIDEYSSSNNMAETLKFVAFPRIM